MNIDTYCINSHEKIMVYFSEAFLFFFWRNKACIFRLLPMETECQCMSWIMFPTSCGIGELVPTQGNGWSWWRWPGGWIPLQGIQLRSSWVKGPANLLVVEVLQRDPMPYSGVNWPKEQAVWSLVVLERRSSSCEGRSAALWAPSATVWESSD